MLMVCFTIILLLFCIHRSRAPLDAYFQVSRTQPQLPANSQDLESRNPASEDVQVASSSDSDRENRENSIENEEAAAEAEPGAVVSEGKYFRRFVFTRLTSRKLRLQKARNCRFLFSLQMLQASALQYIALPSHNYIERI